jgi:hypothetical protein
MLSLEGLNCHRTLGQVPEFEVHCQVSAAARRGARRSAVVPLRDYAAFIPAPRLWLSRGKAWRTNRESNRATTRDNPAARSIKCD